MLEFFLQPSSNSLKLIDVVHLQLKRENGYEKSIIAGLFTALMGVLMIVEPVVAPERRQSVTHIRKLHRLISKLENHDVVAEKGEGVIAQFCDELICFQESIENIVAK